MSTPAQQTTPEPLRKLHARVAEIEQRRRAELPPAITRTGPLSITADLQVRGEAAGDARVHVLGGTGRVVVTVLVRQSCGSLPVLVQRYYDASPASHTAAYSLAHRIKAGTEVHAQGDGLRLHHHKGEPALELLGVKAIYPPAPPTTRKDLE